MTEVSDNINNVPTVFFGFTEKEESAIRSAIGYKIHVGMNQYDAWPIIAKCLKDAGINDVVFVCSAGVQFNKIGGQR